MIVNDRKNSCNALYVKILEMLRNKVDLKVIHDNMVDLAEALFALGRIAPSETENCNKKSIMLIKIAKSFTLNTKHEDIYFQLTGEKLESNDATILEDIQRDLDKVKSNRSDLVNKSNVPPVVHMPKVQTNDKDGIRPQSIDDYIGQERTITQLKELIAAAKIKGKPLEHILLFGSAGLGKTSLSKIIANEMDSNIIILSGPTIKDPLSLVDVIKDVKYGDIVFIDEIHRINPAAAEAMYTVMEDFELSYIEKTKEGSEARNIKLPKFTVVGATTHSGLLEKPMRDRFTVQFKLEMYSVDELSTIAQNTMRKLGKEIDLDAAQEVAKRSRGIPRNCNSFIRRLYDKALVQELDKVDVNLVLDYFNLNGIDENGLQEIDINYMKIIFKNFGNRPVGIDNISSCLGEGKNIIENQVEPYLLYLGFIQITPGGRMLSSAGQDYMEDYFAKKNNR